MTRPPRKLLTQRESEIVRLLRSGLTYPEIRVRLGLSKRTLDGHLANIRAKTGKATTVAAVFHARVRTRVSDRETPVQMTGGQLPG